MLEKFLLTKKVSNFEQKITTIKHYLSEMVRSEEYVVDQVLNEENIKCDLSGVYVFYNVERVFYVGQSCNIKGRLKEHCAVVNYEKANFVYHLTVDNSGIRPIPGSPNSTKKSLFEIPEFKHHFHQSIDFIKQLNFMFIPIEDRLEKNLFEIYASIVLDSKYHDFE